MPRYDRTRPRGGAAQKGRSLTPVDTDRRVPPGAPNTPPRAALEPTKPVHSASDSRPAGVSKSACATVTSWFNRTPYVRSSRMSRAVNRTRGNPGGPCVQHASGITLL